jgi:hypothetical protein
VILMAEVLLMPSESFNSLLLFTSPLCLPNSNLHQT